MNEKQKRTLDDLEPHELKKVGDFRRHWVLRVPGGFIYYAEGTQEECAVFVPFDFDDKLKDFPIS